MFAGVAKSADARDLKSLGSNTVPVQVRSPAPLMESRFCGFLFYKIIVFKHNCYIDFVCVFLYNTLETCRCDGIGRRAGLKIRSWRQGAGSTPAAGTKKSLILLRLFFSAILILTYKYSLVDRRK